MVQNVWEKNWDFVVNSNFIRERMEVAVHGCSVINLQERTRDRIFLGLIQIILKKELKLFLKLKLLGVMGSNDDTKNFCYIAWRCFDVRHNQYNRDDTS